HEAGGSKWLWKLCRRQPAGIGLVHYDHAAVPAQLPGKLALPHIDCIDLGRAALQQTISETAGRSAQVNGRLAADLEPEVIQRLFELESASADEFFRRG